MMQIDLTTPEPAPGESRSPGESIQKYIQPELTEFLTQLYTATDTDKLYLHGGINESNSVGSLEDVFDALSILEPRGKQVIQSLNLMKTLPKESVHQQIQISHVIKFPKQVIKLAEHAERIYSLMTAIDERNPKAYHMFGGVGNITLSTLDKIVEAADHQEELISILDEYITRNIVIHARATYFSENNSCGFLSKPEHFIEIAKNQEQYFKGVDFLINKLDWYKLNTENFGRGSSAIALWEEVFTKNKQICELAGKEDVQKLIVELNDRNLLSDSNLMYILSHFREYEAIAPHADKIIQFVDRYNSMICAWKESNKDSNDYWISGNRITGDTVRSLARDPDEFILAVDTANDETFAKMQAYLDETPWSVCNTARDHFIKILNNEIEPFKKSQDQEK